MHPKDKNHALLRECCGEVLAYVKERESHYSDGLVPATDVNDGLQINFSAVPKRSKDPAGQKGWLFATLARMLEDDELLEHHKKGSRSYYRVVRR